MSRPLAHRDRRRPAWLTRPVLVGLAVALVLLVTAGLAAFTLGGPGRAPTRAGAAPSTASSEASASETASAAPSSTGPAATGNPPPAAPPPPAGPGVRTTKKGVSAWYFPAITAALGDVRASWYYTWASAKGNVTGPAGVEFVPMIWGADAVKQSTLDQARGQGSILLGFNEPDLAGQADMSVATALDLWPRLEATGMRLGSPAPAFGAATAGSWFDQFMAGVASRGYRVDFIALHWYGSDFGPNAANQLKGYLQAVYDRYHKPIWLTEYSLINFKAAPKYPTDAQQAAFATASVAMLESLSFVERYAWFALPATDDSGTGLYRSDGTATAAGAAYRNAA
jgi:putative glycosyl hydrolase